MVSDSTILSFIFRNNNNASAISKIGNVVAIKIFISFSQDKNENNFNASSVWSKGNGSTILVIPLNNKTTITI